MTRIKICGITRPADGRAAARAGADAIGLVFANSPRRVTTAQARAIIANLPPYISTVGVFVNSRAETIANHVAEVGLGEVQLHGDESPGIVEKLRGLRVTKALRVRDRTFLDDVQRFADAGVAAILLDAYTPSVRGGTGRKLDWDLVVGVLRAGAIESRVPLLLAGGLTPMNVRIGIRKLRPWGVDVSSGVELEPGIKCPDKIAEFVAAVRGAV